MSLILAEPKLNFGPFKKIVRIILLRLLLRVRVVNKSRLLLLQSQQAGLFHFAQEI